MAIDNINTQALSFNNDQYTEMMLIKTLYLTKSTDRQFI